MKFYLLRTADTLPNGFGGTSQGPLVRLLPKYLGDVGLLEHEKTHVRQWYAVTGGAVLVGALLAITVSPMLWAFCTAAPGVHQTLYSFVRPYRQWSEVRAYRVQLAMGGYGSREFAAVHLAEKYDLRLTLDEARTLLS